MDLIHATYLFLLDLALLCISLLALLLLETRFGGCLGNSEITTQARPTGIHQKERERKKKGKSKINPFYYQIIPAILLGFSIVFIYKSGIYGVPSVCLNIKIPKCLEGF